jgi:hypothetical protein
VIALGIDPGIKGALVFVDTQAVDGDLVFHPMPVNAQSEIDFDELHRILVEYDCDHIFLERAVPFAQGAKAAFNYGRGFAAVEIAIQFCGKSVTYVEPGKWAKEMHQGIDADLKPKAKTLIAMKRLFPNVSIPLTPKSKKPHDGFIDAFMIAQWGLRQLSGAEASKQAPKRAKRLAVSLSDF